MPQKVRIALDAMGGDVGASVVIPGAATSLARHPDSEFLMFGDSALIEAQLTKYPALKKASRVVHTDVPVSMHGDVGVDHARGLLQGRIFRELRFEISGLEEGLARGPH